MLATITFTAEEIAAQAPHPETITRSATALRAAGCVLLRDVYPSDFIATLREAFLATDASRVRSTFHRLSTRHDSMPTRSRCPSSAPCSAKKWCSVAPAL
jgi:hypothetical protein